MTSVRGIEALVVGVPARNEQDTVVASINSIVDAVAALEHEVAVTISIASDDSTDRTNELLETLAQEEPTIEVVQGVWRSAGGARRAAIDHGLASLATRGFTNTHTTWIATTDADTIVGRDWLVRHLHHANRGCDGVAGVVDIIDDEACTVDLLETFTNLYTLELDSHPHVHGANLGVRASAYLAAEGFPEIVVAEDHALWNELRRRKFRLVSPLDVRVSTSGRLRGRAPGGFADTLSRALSITPVSVRARA